MSEKRTDYIQKWSLHIIIIDYCSAHQAVNEF